MGLGRWPLPYQPIYEGFNGVGVRMRTVAQAAAGCQSENVIAEPETFTLGEWLRSPASVVGARVGLVHSPVSLGFAMIRLLAFYGTWRSAATRLTV